jgi:hypothetical protein
MNEVKDDARKEALKLKEGIDARKDEGELKDLVRKLMNSNSNNSNAIQPQHTLVTSTEKRKHNVKTPSTNPEEKEMTSPDHRKQRQHNVLNIMDLPSTTVPLGIDFEEFTEDIVIDMGNNENNTASSVLID